MRNVLIELETRSGILFLQVLQGTCLPSIFFLSPKEVLSGL